MGRGILIQMGAHLIPVASKIALWIITFVERFLYTWPHYLVKNKCCPKAQTPNKTKCRESHTTTTIWRVHGVNQIFVFIIQFCYFILECYFDDLLTIPLYTVEIQDKLSKYVFFFFWKISNLVYDFYFSYYHFDLMFSFDYQIKKINCIWS